MKKILVKIIVVITLGVFVGGVGFFFWKNKYASQSESLAVRDDSDKTGEDGESAIEQTKSAEEKKEAEKNETRIIGYIEKNIDRIAGKKPVSGGGWKAVRVWFIDNRNFYADYKDSASNLRRILVNQILDGKEASYEVLGYFVPGDNGWVLESGKDIKDAVPAKLYEKNEETNEWTIK